eukprot:8272703-Lingulodinium_polyedra.AAC.1
MTASRRMSLRPMLGSIDRLNHGNKAVGLLAEADRVVVGLFEKVLVSIGSRPPFSIRVRVEHGWSVLGVVIAIAVVTLSVGGFIRNAVLLVICALVIFADLEDT